MGPRETVTDGTFRAIRRQAKVCLWPSRPELAVANAIRSRTVANARSTASSARDNSTFGCGETGSTTAAAVGKPATTRSATDRRFPAPTARRSSSAGARASTSGCSGSTRPAPLGGCGSSRRLVRRGMAGAACVGISSLSRAWDRDPVLSRSPSFWISTLIPPHRHRVPERLGEAFHPLYLCRRRKPPGR